MKIENYKPEKNRLLHAVVEDAEMNLLSSDDKGTKTNPYSMMEFIDLLYMHKWDGGYVTGLGYVGPDDYVVSDDSTSDNIHIVKNTGSSSEDSYSSSSSESSSEESSPESSSEASGSDSSDSTNKDDDGSIYYMYTYCYVNKIPFSLRSIVKSNRVDVEINATASSKTALKGVKFIMQLKSGSTVVNSWIIVDEKDGTAYGKNTYLFDFGRVTMNVAGVSDWSLEVVSYGYL